MKTVIVTGASQGIGRATAVRLSNDPSVANIVVVARSESGLAGTVAQMNTDRVRVLSIPQDLADLDAIGPLVKRIHGEFGRIDVLLNIAGYAAPDALLDATNEDIEATFTINVSSLIVMTRECVKYMRDHPAKIVNVASTAGMTPRPGWVAYAASKAAVISVSQTLTDELAEYGIKVYTISPGRCATELRRKLAPDEDPATIMQPSQVADIIATLLDDSETILDGQNLVVRQQPVRSTA